MGNSCDNQSEQLDTEVEEMRRLVACYMDGDDYEAEFDEEDEYKELVQKPKESRTFEEIGRLRDLAKMLPHLLSAPELREMVKIAWRYGGTDCPYCKVKLVTDHHLKNCPLRVVLGMAIQEKNE